MDQALYTCIFIGRSGCGKGTQAKLLETWLAEHAPAFPTLYVESGARVRALLRHGTYSSALAKALDDAGELQPSFIAVWVWASIFIERMTGKEHLIVDGSPRKLNEAKLLEGAFRLYERRNPHLVYLNVSEEWARERLRERHRSDDGGKNVIDRKMEWFETDVLPAVNHFRTAQGFRFLDINGEQAIEKVHKDIVANIQ